MPHSDCKQPLITAMAEKVMVMDGAMGSLLLSEGHRAPDYMLILERPEVIADIHRRYIEAGADIIRTATFGANTMSVKAHAISDADVTAINTRAVRIVRKAAEAAGHRVFVAASIGPLPITAPASLTSDDIENAYLPQAMALMAEGVDMVIVETVCSSAQAIGALTALRKAQQIYGGMPPILISATTTAESRLISGETIKQLLEAITPFGPDGIGLNCGCAPQMLTADINLIPADYKGFVALAPSAGLPESDGSYRRNSAEILSAIIPQLESGKLNIVGGCCGTTPQFTRLLADAASKYRPRRFSNYE